MGQAAANRAGFSRKQAGLGQMTGLLAEPGCRQLLISALGGAGDLDGSLPLLEQVLCAALVLQERFMVFAERFFALTASQIAVSPLMNLFIIVYARGTKFPLASPFFSE